MTATPLHTITAQETINTPWFRSLKRKRVHITGMPPANLFQGEFPQLPESSSEQHEVQESDEGADSSQWEYE